jgi:hypothetical protein
LPEVIPSAQGTQDMNDLLSEDGKDRNARSGKRHVGGAGCFIEKAQSARLTWGDISYEMGASMRGRQEYLECRCASGKGTTSGNSSSGSSNGQKREGKRCIESESGCGEMDECIR